MSRLIQRLSNRGVYSCIAHEAATELIRSGVIPTNYRPVDFQSMVSKRVIEIEDACMRKARTQKNPQAVVLCDRGVMDSKAYTTPDEFKQVLDALGSNEIEMRDMRYDAVILLRSTAFDARDLYSCDNNPARTETQEQARALDIKTVEAWIGHPHLRIFDNSTLFNTKMNKAAQVVFNVLGMPEPLEIEKKYLVVGFDPSTLPCPSTKIKIVQHYLKCKEEHEEERVRIRQQGGGRMYVHTIKRTVQPGVRIEHESQITYEQYSRLLRRVDPALGVILKTRQCFEYDSQYFELDMFEDGKMLLEIELTKQHDTVTMPSFLKPYVTDVTNDKGFSNYEMARSMAR
jgi:CYTH domain-containing protein